MNSQGESDQKDNLEKKHLLETIQHCKSTLDNLHDRGFHDSSIKIRSILDMIRQRQSDHMWIPNSLVQYTICVWWNGLSSGTGHAEQTAMCRDIVKQLAKDVREDVRDDVRDDVREDVREDKYAIMWISDIRDMVIPWMDGSISQHDILFLEHWIYLCNCIVKQTSQTGQLTWTKRHWSAWIWILPDVASRFSSLIQQNQIVNTLINTFVEDYTVFDDSDTSFILDEYKRCKELGDVLPDGYDKSDRKTQPEETDTTNADVANSVVKETDVSTESKEAEPRALLHELEVDPFWKNFDRFNAGDIQVWIEGCWNSLYNSHTRQNSIKHAAKDLYDNSPNWINRVLSVASVASVAPIAQRELVMLSLMSTRPDVKREMYTAFLAHWELDTSQVLISRHLDEWIKGKISLNEQELSMLLAILQRVYWNSETMEVMLETWAILFRYSYAIVFTILVEQLTGQSDGSDWILEVVQALNDMSHTDAPDNDSDDSIDVDINAWVCAWKSHADSVWKKWKKTWHVEFYQLPDVRLGQDWTSVKSNTVQHAFHIKDSGAMAPAYVTGTVWLFGDRPILHDAQGFENDWQLSTSHPLKVSYQDWKIQKQNEIQLYESMCKWRDRQDNLYLTSQWFSMWIKDRFPHGKPEIKLVEPTVSLKRKRVSLEIE